MIVFDENIVAIDAQFEESDQAFDAGFETAVVIAGNTNVNGDFSIDHTLKLENGVLSVNTVNKVEANNTLPVTSAAVHVTVGNIEALLNAI